MKRLETMIERLDWVLDNRQTVVVTKKGKPVVVDMNPGNWALAAGVSRKALYNQMDRMREAPHKTLKASTVELLAPVARVAVGWLASGEGDPDDRSSEPTTEIDERYPVIRLLRDAAKADGIDPAFVNAFVADLDKDDQPSFRELWGLFASALARHERKTRALGDPGAGLDDRPPPQTARKKR